MSTRLLTPTEITAIEAEHPQGLSSKEIIDLFQDRGVKLSESTFRKYVQIGLLPGCTRRVGTKGKHKGSRGIYPVSAVRRVNLIKKMMNEGMTLDDIRNSFLTFRNDIDLLQDALENLFRDFARHLEGRSFEPVERKQVKRQFQESQKSAEQLVRRLEKIGSAIAARPMGAE